MDRLILKIYDKFKVYPRTAWIIFFVVSALLALLVATLSYKEDISDFLPLDEKNQTAMSVYQDVSGANKIYAIVSVRDTAHFDTETIISGIDEFAGNVSRLDSVGFISSMMTEIDMERMLGYADTVYNNIPYFLTENDYRRIDSLLNIPGYVQRQIVDDKQMLMLPSGQMLATNIARDPLNLFTPVLGRLKQAGMSIDFDTSDGYILTPDGKRGVVIMESSFGASESDHNGALMQLLNRARDDAQTVVPNLDIHIIGGPAIAVANADRIKSDSMLAIAISAVLIIALLIYVFRNLRNILLIVVSVSWGALFALGSIAVFYDSVSIIVIGIASVILGIAVNYPLHLIDHLKESLHPRSALKEIVAPLVVGNVTTVGAFLCLVSLESPALHDLGLFSSLLLVGTILFVLIFLPHIVRTRRVGEREAPEPKLISALAGVSLENKPWVVWGVLALTVVFAYFGRNTEFDSDMRNINYMTPEQKRDMAYFQSLAGTPTNTENLYVVSSGSSWEEALKQNEAIKGTLDSLVNEGTAVRSNQWGAFVGSSAEQKKRLDRWNRFVRDFDARFRDELRGAAVREGFANGAFSTFDDIMDANYAERDFSQFREFLSSVFVGSVSEDKESGRKSLVHMLSVPVDRLEEVKERIDGNREFGGLCFDVRSMNGSIANTLSNDFNYIGFVCGFVVFAFLWLSLGSIELAMVSFLPMAVSWIWILGIMGLLGLKFNIVNIILATFIFGQGDDYTIFITEGLSYEYAYRKKLLASYKSSIVVSALIMFIGIGTLLFAKHPAMRSLGEVTVVGMMSVVLMAYLFPPLMFKWLTTKNGKVRRHPVTLKTLFMGLLGRRTTNCYEEVYGRYIYKGVEIQRNARRALKRCAAQRDKLDSLVARRTSDAIYVADRAGQGEIPLLIGLLYPDAKVVCAVVNDDAEAILRASADGFIDNLEILPPRDFETVAKSPITIATDYIIQ